MYSSGNCAFKLRNRFTAKSDFQMFKALNSNVIFTLH